MYEQVGRIWWSIVLTVIFVAGSELETIPECINCNNEHSLKPELGEYVKSQKIVHRLEYIKQQLMSSLRMRNATGVPLKLDSLPDFLVQKLVQEDTSKIGYAEGFNEDQTNRKMAIFAEQENTTCGSDPKRAVCLNFKPSDDIFSSDRFSAALWFHRNSLPIHGKGMQNFTIVDITSPGRNRDSRTINSNYITDNKDGWYQIDVTELVYLWREHKANKRRVLMVLCDSCARTDYATDSTSRPANKTAFLLLNTESEESARLKRGSNCESEQDECCREDLWVNFTAFGPSFTTVMTPDIFNAFVCRGSCRLDAPVDTPYAYMKGKMQNETKYRVSSLPTTCCTPTRFSHLPVVFASDSHVIERLLVPNMIVESCGCV